MKKTILYIGLSILSLNLFVLFADSANAISLGQVSAVTDKTVNLSASGTPAPGAPKASSIKKGDILVILNEDNSVGEVKVTKTMQTMGGKKVLIEAEILSKSMPIKTGMGFRIK
ncbi:MAG TPA: hypothetical protein PK079_19900 [Leptospiraceae bacterium]|nr:hypothetical protein [Leptospiraceae bacterium]HMW07690.1 hypothetical protein [Leptospiraceae bacterium]HMX34105.1 hypothetical protein [Leptospiraceae bacterium]HMY33296.1 hypothetical protein [Leptospiraceae bacterium]HMZ63033.1 hypothetical protein [Leptospiraceae bacterium]